MSLVEEAFDVLYEDLIATRPECACTNAVLCPICLRPITRYQVMKQGVEHIIPRGVTEKDSAGTAALGTLNQRSGITILCRAPRPIRSGGREARDGCNGFKGSTYDWAMRKVLDDKPHARNEFSHRHGVAVLVMAYLGDFQTFGYGYILTAGLEDVRAQFDYPDDRRTALLDEARFRLQPLASPVIATSLGQPFAFGMETGRLIVLFRRCMATLPPLNAETRGVRSLATLLRKLPE